jgi:hypothetical protein
MILSPAQRGNMCVSFSLSDFPFLLGFLPSLAALVGILLISDYYYSQKTHPLSNLGNLKSITLCNKTGGRGRHWAGRNLHYYYYLTYRYYTLGDFPFFPFLPFLRKTGDLWRKTNSDVCDYDI